MTTHARPTLRTLGLIGGTTKPRCTRRPPCASRWRSDRASTSIEGYFRLASDEVAHAIEVIDGRALRVTAAGRAGLARFGIDAP